MIISGSLTCTPVFNFKVGHCDLISDILGEQVERRDFELLYNTLGQINLLPSV